jgi:hypothetical protein
MHTTTPPWLGHSITAIIFGCYVPVMVMVLYAVSSHAFWVTGLAKVYYAVCALLCLLAACVLYAILWRRITVMAAEGNAHLTDIQIDQPKNGQIDRRLVRAHSSIDTDVGQPTNCRDHPMFHGLVKALPAVCLGVPAAAYHISQGIAVVNTPGPFPRWSHFMFFPFEVA